MSSIAKPEPELPAADELVAYLDGELPPEVCRRVEERLAADADYRQQLRELDQAWEALDALPTTKADDNFARTTMELLTVAAQRDVSSITADAVAARHKRAAWWTAAGITTVIVGFVAAQALLPDKNESLLADLPVIRQVDVLRHVEDVAFLRELSLEAPLQELAYDESAIDEELAQLAPLADASRTARRRWVEMRSSEQKIALAAQAKRFDGLARIEGEQDRLRKLHRDIRQADDADELQKTLIAYGQWLDGLAPGEQAQLRDELQDRTPAEQVAHIQQVIRRENARESYRMTADESATLRKEVLAMAKLRQVEFLAELRRRGEFERLRRLDGPRGAIMILIRDLQGEEGIRIRERLVNQLSPEAQAHFERLGRGGRRWQFWLWMRESLQPKLDPADMERFFAEKLDNKQRERLLSMSPGEMQAQLEHLYFASEFGFRDSSEWWNDFREWGGRRNAPGDGRRGFDRGRSDRRPAGPPGPRRDGLPDGGPPHRPGPPPNGAPELRNQNAI